MGLLDGFTECWVPSVACKVDWDAWSAIGSTAAVVVALLVGVLPVVNHLWNGRARARVKGAVFLAQLDLATFWISIGRQVAEMAPAEPHHYNAAIGFALNCRRVDTSIIMPEIEYLPRDIARLIGSFAARALEFERTVCGNDGQPLRAPEEFSRVPTGHAEVEPLLEVAVALQARMHLWLFPDLSPPSADASRPTARRIHEQLTMAEDAAPIDVQAR